MFIRHQFEIRQMELFGSDGESRDRIIKYHHEAAKRKLIKYALDKIEFKPFINPYRYKLALVISEEERYFAFRKRLSNILHASGISPIYFDMIKELFSDFENGINENDNSPLQK